MDQFLPSTAVEIGNAVVMVATIAAGGIAFLKPRATMAYLKMTTNGSTEGLSEMRAASGGLFVVMGFVGLLVMSPWVPVMLGVAYAGAALGRTLGIFLDKAGTTKIWIFWLWEAAFAAWLLIANVPRLSGSA